MLKKGNYELIMVVDGNLTDEECQEVINKHKEVLSSAGGTLTREISWGRRRLAYEVQKRKYGIYHLLYIEGDGSVIEEIERQFGYDENVIKFFAVKVKDIDEAYNEFVALKENPQKTANLISEAMGA